MRQRDLEFAPDRKPSGAELVEDLARAVSEADAALAGLDPLTLEARVEIQGLSVTRFGALYHAVEHFSMHTGQIIWIVKARTGRDLEFYNVDNGVARARWPRAQDGP